MTAEVELQIIMLGVGGVGKSAICQRFIKNEYTGDYDPTIEDRFKKRHLITDLQTTVTLNILDTAGQTELANTQDYSRYVSADAYIIVFSVISSASFLEAQEMLNKLTKEFGLKEILCNQKTLVLCANKCDISETNHQVTQQDIKKLADSYQTKLIYYTSAKDNISIQAMFDNLCRDIVQKRGLASEDKLPQNMTQQTNNDRKCCVVL